VTGIFVLARLPLGTEPTATLQLICREL